MDAIAISVNDAAKALSLGRTSIYALIDAKQLETLKVGRRRLVLMESIKRLVAKQD
jgi:excisionase family DNA binding protein